MDKYIHARSKNLRKNWNVNLITPFTYLVNIITQSAQTKIVFSSFKRSDHDAYRQWLQITQRYHSQDIRPIR